MDVLTKKQRSYCMSRIRCKDTQPEMVVRKIVHALGHHYRLHVRRLPGYPDIVLPRHKKVIFVHGCWWHRHNCRLGRRSPKSRKEYWIPKLQGNKERDKIKLRELRKNGWSVMTIWECQTMKPEKLIDRIADFLKKVD